MNLKEKIINLKATSVILLLSVVILSGCVTREKPVLSLTAKQAMQSGQFVMMKNFPELGADIEGANSGQVMGGLLFAMADVAIMAKQEHDQEELMAPIKQKVQSIDLVKNTKASVEPVLGQNAKLQLANQEIEFADLDSYIADHKAEFDGIGSLMPRYRFLEDFSSLMATLDVQFYPTSSSFKTALGVSEGFDQPALKTTLQHIYKPEGAGTALPRSPALKDQAKKNLAKELMFAGPTQTQQLIEKEIARIRTETKDTNAKLWAANDGAEIKKAIAQATESLKSQLQTTLSVMFPSNVANAKTDSPVKKN